MTTTFHIECTAAVPAGTDFADPRDALSAISVTPRVRPSSAAETASDDVDRAAFEAALARIRTGRYWLLTLASSAAGWEVRAVAEATREYLPDPEIFDLPQWLAQHRKAEAAAGFYTSRRSPAVDEERVCASELVRKASGWAAPIPQKLGLIALLSHAVTGPGIATVLVLLDAAADDPQPGDFTVSGRSAATCGEQLKIAHADGTLCRTAILHPHQRLLRIDDSAYSAETAAIWAKAADLAYAAFREDLDIGSVEAIWSVPVLPAFPDESPDPGLFLALKKGPVAPVSRIWN
ncbi:MAG: hypothetical protein ACK4GT_06620 [Pararhodobacter sp.]